MISNKAELIKVLKLEKDLYFKDNSYFESLVTSDQIYYVYKFIRYLVGNYIRFNNNVK